MARADFVKRIVRIRALERMMAIDDPVRPFFYWPIEEIYDLWSMPFFLLQKEPPNKEA